jgi:hypothetical protein
VGAQGGDEAGFEFENGEFAAVQRGGTSNIQHPTSNTQLEPALHSAHSMLDVGY